MQFDFFDFLRLAGSLGFFIFGMKIMSEGIQKIAGNQMRQILNAMTSNRVTGVFTGFLTTSLVQSSSATTVMVVSFVNAGLLSLKQAVGVIMGANIGTTMTAILVTVFGFSKFSLAEYALPIIAVGFPMMFARSVKLKSWAEFLIGFAILFMGISALKDAVPEFSAEALHFLQDLNDMGILSTLIFVLIGTVLTVILQSSSAAMTLTLVLCEKGIIQFDMAAAIVLGENIGTTITANLAALVGNVHAKRAARAHFLFNVFGVVWMILLLPVFLNAIDNIMSGNGYGAPMQDVGAIKWGLTAFHISFNVINTLLLVWMVNLIVKAVIKLVPSKGDDTAFSLEYINSGVMRTPELSILEATREVARFGHTTAKMANLTLSLLEEPSSKNQEKLIQRIRQYEEITDRAEEEISKYLSRMSEDDISQETSRKISHLLSIVNDLETIGDLYYQITLVFERKTDKDIYFLPDQRNVLKEMLKKNQEAFKVMVRNLDVGEKDVNLEQAEIIENDLNAMHNKLRKMHLKGIEKGEFNVKSAMVFSELYTTIERVGDHILKVSEALVGKV